MNRSDRSIHNPKFEFEPADLARFVSSSFLRSDYEAVSQPASQPTYFGGIELDSVAVFRHEGKGSTRGYRRLDHFRADHVDDFLLSLPLRGKITVTQGGPKVAVEPGSFILCSTAKPFAESTMSDRTTGTFKSFHVRVSGSMLRSRLPRVDRYCHVPVRISAGPGEIMTSMFSLALDCGPKLSVSQSRNFGTMVIDVIANAMSEAPELTCLHPESRETSFSRVRQMAGHLIECNLSNPVLSPAMVAEQCHVSLRYLHAAFAAGSQSVGSLIRETRLDRCREALRNHALHDYSIFEIAVRWGFSDHAHFSRAYKLRFGVTPKIDRAAANTES